MDLVFENAHKFRINMHVFLVIISGDAFFEDGNLETSLSYKQMPVHEHYDEEEEDHIR